MGLAFPRARLGVVCLPFFLVFAGCKSNGTSPTTTFTGSVQLYDMYGNALADNSGVTVSAYDNAASNTVTAADGSFTLASVDATTPLRLKIEKASFGTYYTDELPATGATYALPKRVRLGQYSSAHYQVTYAPSSAGRYLVIQGTRVPAGTDTKLLMHRVHFNFAMFHVTPLLYSSKFSKGFRNNLATGFSDTIRYDRLAAAGLYSNMEAIVATDNLVADSCASPYQTYSTAGQPEGPVFFRKTYPAGGINTGEVKNLILPGY